MAGSKSKSNVPLANPIETGRESVRSLKKHTTKWMADEASHNSKTFLEQLLGMNMDSKSQKAADAPQENPAERKFTSTGIEVFDVFIASSSNNEKKPAPAQPEKPRAEAAMNYHQEISRSSERANSQEMQQMSRNIQDIKFELKKLVESSQVLKMDFAQIDMEEAPQEVGQYHINFFEWMLTVIRQARSKVEDSGAWLQTTKGKGQKKGYWGMFKKHGTSFGLSGERAVATQVG